MNQSGFIWLFCFFFFLLLHTVPLPVVQYCAINVSEGVATVCTINTFVQRWTIVAMWTWILIKILTFNAKSELVQRRKLHPLIYLLNKWLKIQIFLSLVFKKLSLSANIIWEEKEKKGVRKSFSFFVCHCSLISYAHTGRSNTTEAWLNELIKFWLHASKQPVISENEGEARRHMPPFLQTNHRNVSICLFWYALLTLATYRGKVLRLMRHISLLAGIHSE